VTPPILPKGISLVFFCFIFFFVVPSAHAANRYWLGVNDRWESTANWSTSNGGAAGASVPGTSDMALLLGAGTDPLARSNINVGGMLIADSSLTLGTGSLRIGTSGLRLGQNADLLATGRPVSVAGSVTQTGGFVLELSSTLSLSGNLLVNNLDDGNFVSTGTIIFNGNTNQTLITDGSQIFSNVIVRNSGSTGNNTVSFDCDGFCLLGIYASGNFNVERGIADFATYTNYLTVVDGHIIIGTGSTTAALTTNAHLVLSGSFIVGSNGTLITSGDSGITFTGQSAKTLNPRNSLIPYFYIDEGFYSELSLPQFDGASRVTLASNVRTASGIVIGANSSLSLSSYTFAATGASITNNGTINENTGRLVHAATNFANKDINFSTTTTTVGAGNKLYITINEGDANLSGASRDTLSVAFTTADGDSETLTLQETGNATGVFRGSIGTAFTAFVNTNDGAIQLTSASTTVTLTYTDSQDGLSNSTSVTLAASVSSDSNSSANTTTHTGGGRRTSSLASPPARSAPAITHLPSKDMTLKERIRVRRSMRNAKLEEVIAKRRQDRLSRRHK
jgi:hypothetical protein